MFTETTGYRTENNNPIHHCRTKTGSYHKTTDLYTVRVNYLKR